MQLRVDIAVMRICYSRPSSKTLSIQWEQIQCKVQFKISINPLETENVFIIFQSMISKSRKSEKL
jgi:hypothetical protein